MVFPPILALFDGGPYEVDHREIFTVKGKEIQHVDIWPI